MVFDGPNSGRPSAKRAPPSRGRAKVSLKMSLAATGVPLATANKIRS
jgi:hypothetical protein